MFFVLGVLPLLTVGLKKAAELVEYKQVLRETKEKPQFQVHLTTPIVLNAEEYKEYLEAMKIGDQRTAQRLRRRGEFKNTFVQKGGG